MSSVNNKNSILWILKGQLAGLRTLVSFTLNIPDISFLHGEDRSPLLGQELAPVGQSNRGVSPVLRGRLRVHGVKSKIGSAKITQNQP